MSGEINVDIIKMWKSFSMLRTKLPYCPAIPVTGCLPKADANVSIKRQLHACVYCGVIHKVMYYENMIHTVLLQQQDVAVVPCDSCTNMERT